MPNAVVLKVDAGILPQGLCAQSYQELLNAFANVSSVTLPTESDIWVIQRNKPDVGAQGTKFWLQTDPLGRPVHIYWFAQGYWLCPHPDQTGMIKILTASMTDADLLSYDGGDGTAADETLDHPMTGPMWMRATELNALFPIGSSPTTAFPSGTAVHTGDTGGEEKHTLTTDEIPAHQHLIVNKDDGTALPNPANTVSFQGHMFGGSTDYSLGATATPAIWGLTSNAGGGLGHSNIPPYLGVTFIKRTRRMFYSVQGS